MSNVTSFDSSSGHLMLYTCRGKDINHINKGEYMKTKPNIKPMRVPSKPTCPDCERVFDMTNEEDANEYYYGHDCEEN